MVKKGFVPQRGQVVWLDFDPQAGHEQAGRRPALVLSPDSYNRPTELALFCPITNQAKGYPFEVKLPAELSVRGVVLADQMKNMDWKKRRATYLCDVPDDVLEDVLEKVLALIDPEE
jgi:mRNA interferase MazF